MDLQLLRGALLDANSKLINIHAWCGQANLEQFSVFLFPLRPRLKNQYDTRYHGDYPKEILYDCIRALKCTKGTGSGVFGIVSSRQHTMLMAGARFR
jgi:hypothetical protein